MVLDTVNVLLLEDNATEARLVRELLSATSQYPGDYPWFEIECTGYLREGLARLAASEAAAAPAVDVVLFNLRLLDSDQWDTFTALQAYAQQTPLIMLTGYAEEAWGLCAVQQGAQDYLPKDDLTGRLLARSILYAIERHRLETELRQHRDQLEEQVAARTAELEAEVTAHRQAEEQLHKSEQYFRTLAENSPDVIARFDRECRHVYVNATISHYVDLTPQDYVGKTNRELGLPENRVKQWEHHLHTVFETGKRQVYEFEFEGLQGKTVFSCLLVPEYNERDQIQTVLSVARDVTVRKQAEATLRESEALFHLQFKLGNIGITIASPEKAWLHINQHLCDMLGYSEAELQQTTWESLTHPDDLAADTAQFQRMVAGEIDGYEMDKRFIRKDGTIVYTHLAVSCYRNPDRTLRFTIGSIQNITAQKHAEQEITRYAAELQRSNEDLQQFTVTISHDLQAPLRGVIRFLDLLEEHYRSELDAEAQEYIDFAVTGAQRMRQLIRDLLQYSRIDSRGQAPAPTATAPLVANILQILQFQIADCGAEITHDPLPEVYADATQVRQLFQNLLDNALKFRRPDVPPRIHIAVKHQGDRWQFAVHDNGIGIAPAYHEEIFQIFRRLHTAEEYEGTGIGLAICRKIVERHGGRMWLASAEKQGATFYFTLPVVPEAYS